MPISGGAATPSGVVLALRYRFGFGVDVCGAGRRRGEHPSGSCDRVECVGARRTGRVAGRGVLGAGAGAGQLGVAGGLGLCAAGSDAVLDDGDVVINLVYLPVAALQHLGWRLRGYRFGFGVDVCGAGRRRGEHPWARVTASNASGPGAPVK